MKVGWKGVAVAGGLLAAFVALPSSAVAQERGERWGRGDDDEWGQGRRERFERWQDRGRDDWRQDRGRERWDDGWGRGRDGWGQERGRGWGRGWNRGWGRGQGWGWSQRRFGQFGRCRRFGKDRRDGMQMLRRFKELPPERRQEILRKMFRRFQELPPERKREIMRKLFQRFQQLPPEKKREIMRELGPDIRKAIRQRMMERGGEGRQRFDERRGGRGDERRGGERREGKEGKGG